MESDNDDCDYLNKADEEVEYVQDTPYIRQILDIPEVEISVTDESCYHVEEEETKYNIPPAVEEAKNIIITETVESEENWDENKVKTLLNMYLENVDKFRNPKVRKKSLWKKIGEVLGKDADTCDKKFRNLKQHYFTVLRKKRQFGRSFIRWPFFPLFEQISNRAGFHPTDRFRYRPIAKKPEWGTPQYVMLSNPPNAKTPIIVNSATPVNSSITSISVCDMPDVGPQKRRNLDGFQSVSGELITRQENIELKLDRLVEVVEESNNIQRERNRLFQEYLKKMNK